MPKSSRQQPSRKSRTTQRPVQDVELSPSDNVEPVARARRNSSSTNSSSTISASSSRNQQSIKSSKRKRPTDGRIVDNEDSTAKRPSILTSNEPSQAGSSRKRRTLSVSIETKDLPTATKRPLTRSQRAALQVITPSPAQSKSKQDSTSFPFSTPPTNKRRNTLPEGVIDIYPEEDCQHAICSCGADHCSARTLTSSYIHTYGKEYWQHLKDVEEPTILLPTSSSADGSPGSRSTRSDAQSPGDDHDDEATAATAETPEYNRDWVFLNPEAVDSPELHESTKYLPYQPDLTPKMRSILVDWIIELSEHFNFGPTALHLAVTLVDKVLACGPIRIDEDSDDEADSDAEDESKTNCFLISRERFQLLGAACTWVACKVEEMSPPNVDDFAYVSDNIYTTFQIKRMERRICKALNFACWHHTPLLFSYEFIRASHECSNTSCHDKHSSLFRHMVMYMLELGRLPYSPVTKKPSLLAAAAVYLARANLGIWSNDTTLDPLGRWTRTLEFYTGYSKADLKETVLAIHRYHLAAEESSLKSVFTKYRAKRYMKVALKTVPTQQDIGF